MFMEIFVKPAFSHAREMAQYFPVVILNELATCVFDLQSEDGAVPYKEEVII